MLLRLKIAAAVLLLTAVIYLAYVWRSAQTALRAGVETAAHAGEIAATFAPFRGIVSAFETIAAPQTFNASVTFNGDVYHLAPAALSNSSRTWHVGRELPATVLLSFAVRTGAAEPELWIATEGAGVLIYDGHLLRQLLPARSALRTVSAVLPLANGQVLLGTPAAGLYVSDGRVLRLFHAVFASTEVTALAGDEDQLWVGTRNDGVWQWKGGTAIHFTRELPDQQVLSLAATGDRAWVGTALGVTEFSHSKLSRQLASGLFARALTEHQGTLRIETLDQGTRLLPLNTPHARQTLVASTLPTAAQHVTALHHDPRGNLWIGSFDHGVDMVSARGIDHREDDRLFCINRIREHKGIVAVATANGLALFDETAHLRQVLDRDAGLIASHITDVLFTGSSTVVATPAGLSFIGNGVSSLFGFQGLVNNHVYTLAEWNGTLYAGTLGGVSEVRNGLVQASFTTANSNLHQNWITASEVFQDKLYLGTYGSGVVEFDKSGAVTPFTSFAKARTEINPNALLATPQALFAGTAGRGLAVLRAGSDRWSFITGGLPSWNVTALAADNGILYLGTANGVVQIAERSLLR